MKLKTFIAIMCIIPGIATAAERGSARVGVTRNTGAASRAPTSVDTLRAGNTTSAAVAAATPTATSVATTPTGDCRDEFRSCMDEFCLLDESQGYRCACSSNIEKSKGLIQEIQKIQEDTEKMYTEDVEREKLGAKADLIFVENKDDEDDKWAKWLKSDDDETLGEDVQIGDNLYAMALEFCESKLGTCEDRAEMEEALYSRMIVSDCKTYESYLAEQKINVNANKRTAEAAVRAARLEMIDTTNKYNRGECLLAYRSCIADKGGCGAHFENCLDDKLLARRANACENILDQCMAVRKYVLEDWEEESKSILADAKVYADKNERLTCLARIQVCLEDGCSTSSNTACLTDVNVAAGVCPVIKECEAKIPGIQTAINDKLAYLRTRFCQNDVDKCLRDKCGENFNAPECLGKSAAEIAKLCPQKMHLSCKGEKQFDIIVQSVLLQMDYQMLQGCLNYFGEQLGLVCGTDMSCLPGDETVAALTEMPTTSKELSDLRAQVRANSKNAVAEFFEKFQKDITMTACESTQQPAGKNSTSTTIFNTAKIIAEIGAENRALREFELKIAELSRAKSVEEAKENCLNTYQVEEKPKEGEKKNFSYIRSVSFEPKTRTCHVCRKQQVCATGGENSKTGALKGLAGGAAMGASAGTSVMPGWGTAIGTVVGAVGGLFAGKASSKQEEYCQEIDSCEDINF